MSVSFAMTFYHKKEEKKDRGLEKIFIAKRVKKNKKKSWTLAVPPSPSFGDRFSFVLTIAMASKKIVVWSG